MKKMLAAVRPELTSEWSERNGGMANADTNGELQ